MGSESLRRSHGVGDFSHIVRKTFDESPLRMRLDYVKIRWKRRKFLDTLKVDRVRKVTGNVQKCVLAQRR